MSSMWGTGVCLPSQSAPGKHNKKPTYLCAPRKLLKNVFAMFDNHTILLFRLQNKHTFHVFMLCDLCFVLCSLDLSVLGAQRIMGFFILITHKSLRSKKPIKLQWMKHSKWYLLIACYLCSDRTNTTTKTFIELLQFLVQGTKFAKSQSVWWSYLVN